ncbi:hypothetical protein ASAP_3136 [Asaia bogorensis]|uniref:Uncharacterized protein n=1 Tax=Asaia bogorensis TaxID=91915 RepID=A0A060QM02_9PROT|nr:hypothetical protein ASAP_3136 [Asaia bogorensis]
MYTTTMASGKGFDMPHPSQMIPQSAKVHINQDILADKTEFMLEYSHTPALDTEGKRNKVSLGRANHASREILCEQKSLGGGILDFYAPFIRR